ncbi:short-chain fatty acyl-CoA regulator family protein [Tomitella fengzijianii]|uniref:ImmA/IrrE family metallo-endopeptidase n=1 Tax=Tomitella fengzijianii TaxID=2597660 RepID=A0A516X7P6_9ACTN|nr:short-chain fatty acyl-CoA regulator family protein [Tomitella fengzijianii]QDQ99080.1 ImmA/IrrE family metallo-endopeptidase [Tomitella fengzijianii]
MQKMFVGARLRRLREERRLSQAGLARVLELSPSYVNQLENDLRPLTVPVMMRLSSAFDLELDFFASDGDARLIADLDEVFADSPATERPTVRQVEELVSRMPDVGRTLVRLHRRLHAATEQAERLSGRAVAHPDGASAPASEPDGAGDSAAVGDGIEGLATPYEDVRDFFYGRRNHFAELDSAAEELFESCGLRPGGLDIQLARLLRDEHGVTVRLRTDDPRSPGPKREYDAAAGVLFLARRLDAGQRAFQMATQIALLTRRAVIDAIADASGLAPQSAALARVGLANYFAGALLLPYTRFLDAAEELRYDIDLLSVKFEVGFETVCHRLSTLQRPGQRGVPFFFVRTDRAGNISKRQSATAFHFSRVGGSCPLWVVHDAFASPGRVLTQVAQMPDGRTYLWIARTTHEDGRGYRAPGRTFAVGLGCDIGHADRLVYSEGRSLADPGAIVPIGAGCKVCDRPQCAQRAFPPLGSRLQIDEDVSSQLPYRHAYTE